MQASDWLSKQLVDLQMKVETSQEKLVRYQKEHEILGTENARRTEKPCACLCPSKWTIGRVGSNRVGAIIPPQRQMFSCRASVLGALRPSGFSSRMRANAPRGRITGVFCATRKTLQKKNIAVEKKIRPNTKIEMKHERNITFSPAAAVLGCSSPKTRHCCRPGNPAFRSHRRVKENPAKHKN